MGIVIKKLKHRPGYVVLGCPWPDHKWCGPYDTKREAEEAVRGIKRAIENERK